MKTLLLPLALFAATADAYVMRSATHSGSNHTVYLNPWIQVLMPTTYDRLQDAAAKVNANASALRFTLADDNDVVQTLRNGESEADILDTSTVCSSIACAFIWSSGGTLTETDAYFDIDYGWELSDTKTLSKAYVASEQRPLVNTAIHEFAHTLGVKHESDIFQIMGNAWNVVNTNGSVTETVISEDTTRGLVSVYGQRSATVEDLSVYHWQWAGASGAYSTHERTPVTTWFGGSLSDASGGSGEPAWYVNAGQRIRVTQTVENRGTSNHTVKVRWYVSTNDLITSGDTLVASSTLTKARNGPYTWDREITLPSNLALGQDYWVGLIVDADDTVSEMNELNNAAYIARLVVR